MDLPQQTVDYLSSLELRAVERVRDVRTVFRMCQSPMEQLFLQELLTLHDGSLAAYASDAPEPHIVIPDFMEPHALGFDLEIYPQYPVAVQPPAFGIPSEVKQLHLDFLVQIQRWSHDRGVWEKFGPLAIEVDGHDFHERTKEQERRDKTRDRYVTTLGYAVFRFTGSELFNQATDKMLEVGHFLNQRVFQFCAERNLKFY